jgi:hypothetical protein
MTAYGLKVRALLAWSGGQQAVGIKKVDDHYRIIHLRPVISLTRYITLREVREGRITGQRADGTKIPQDELIAEAEEGLPEDFRDVESRSCEAPIEP